MARNYDWEFDYYQVGNIINAYPMTIAAWMKPDVVDQVHVAFGHSNDNQTGPMALLGVNASAYPMMRVTNAAATSSDALAGSTVSAGTWIHVAGVLNGNTDRYCFLNGVAGTQDTTSVVLDMTDFDALGIGGAWYSNSPQLEFDGSVGICAIWDVALSTSEIASLAAGFHPLFIRPQSIINLQEIIKLGLPVDLMSGTAFATTGAPTNVANDYPIILPAASQLVVPTAASAASTTPVITNAEDETFDSTETDIVVTGTDFLTDTGSADLELGDSATYGSATLVSQSTDSWADTSIQFDLTLGVLDGETSLWLYVTDSVGTVSNAWAVTIVYPAGDTVDFYKTGTIGTSITDEGLDITILLVRDE